MKLMSHWVPSVSPKILRLKLQISASLWMPSGSFNLKLIECNGRVSSGGTWVAVQKFPKKFLPGWINSHFVEYDHITNKKGNPDNGYKNTRGFFWPYREPLWDFRTLKSKPVIWNNLRSGVYLSKCFGPRIWIIRVAPLHKTEFSISVINGRSSKKGLAGCRWIRRESDGFDPPQWFWFLQKSDWSIRVVIWTHDTPNSKW